MLNFTVGPVQESKEILEVGALVLHEFFLTRRPKYRRIRDNYVFVNGIYSGIRRR